MTTHVVPMDEQQVREAIDARIASLEHLMQHEQDGVAIAMIGFAVDTLIALEHDLHLCGCSEEVYEKAGEMHENND